MNNLPHLCASVETCHWGAFDAALQPVMTVSRGQRLSIDTVSGGAAVLPPAGFQVPPALLDIHARSPMLAPGASVADHAVCVAGRPSKFACTGRATCATTTGPA